MNLGEMRETLARDVLQRDDVNESLTTAIQFAHREVQRTKDWRAMEARAVELPYAAGLTTGITVSSTYKKAREVYINEGGGILKSVLPATEADVNKLRRIAYNARGITSPTEAAYVQRWYEAGLKIVLFIPPAEEINLDVEYYRYIPFYTDQGDGTADIVDDANFGENKITVSNADAAKFYVGQSLYLQSDETVVKQVVAIGAPGVSNTDITLNSVLGLANGDTLALGATSSQQADATDYFSENIPQILIWGAAYYMSKYIFEDGRADHFLQVYKGLLEEAYVADLQSKMGMNKTTDPRTRSREAVAVPAGR